MTFVNGDDNLTNMENNEKEGYKMIFIHHLQKKAEYTKIVTSPINKMKM
ncbi:hypothetical protein J7I91_17405 [Pseudomonas sp. ISL-84]|nr:hypothetical protein [Pseudomonas sp. ISL-84]